MLSLLLLTACLTKETAELEASARQKLEAGDTAGAIIDARNALASKPSSASGRLELGRALLAAGELPAAAIELQRAEEAGARDAELQPLQAQLWLEQGKSAAVIRKFKSVRLDDNQAGAELQLTLAKAHLLQDEPEAAMAALSDTLNLVSGHAGALIMQARMTAQSGDSPAALQSLDKLLTEQPKLAAAWSAKADLLVASGGNPAAALQAYRKAIELKPKLAQAHAGLIRLLMQQGNPSEFKQQLDLMVKALPKDPTTSYFQGVHAYQTGKYARARELGQFLLRRAGDQAPLLYLTAMAEWRLGGLGQAESLLTRMLQLYPDSLQARRELASLLLQSGQSAKALLMVAPLTATVAAEDADAWSLQGQAQLQVGDFKAAEASFTRASQLRPTDARIRTEIGKSMITRGELELGLRELEGAAQASHEHVDADLQLIAVHMARANPQAALKAAAALAAKQPQSPLAELVKGRILQAQPHEAGARQAFEAALLKDAQYLPAVSSLADMDLAKNDLVGAAKRYQALLDVQPKSAAAMMALAVIARRAGKEREVSNDWLNKAVAAAPQDATVWREAIQFHRDDADPDAALARAQAAVAAVPNEGSLLAELAATQLVARQPRQAIQTLHQLAQLLPQSPDAQLRLAQAQVDAGDLKAARQHVDRAVELAPHWPAAARASVAMAKGPEKNPQRALQVAQALQARPTVADLGWELQGEIEEAQGRHDAAAAAYRKALEKGASSTRASALHRVLMKQGQTAAAAAWQKDWLTAHPADPTFLRHLAESASQRDDLVTAEAHYRTLLSARPLDVPILNNLAYVLAQRHSPDALTVAKRAAGLAPYQPAVLDTLAYALAQDKQHDQASKVMVKVVELAPKEGGFRLTLARYLIVAGKTEQARDELRRLTLPGTAFPQREAAEKLLRETAG